MREIPNAELWQARTEARRRLAEYAQEKAEGDRLLRGEPLAYVRAGAELLDADTLTFGFARRLAGYKRLVAARRRRRTGAPDPVWGRRRSSC